MNSLQKLFEDAEYFCLKLRILLSATFLTDRQLNNRIHSVIVSRDFASSWGPIQQYCVVLRHSTVLAQRHIQLRIYLLGRPTTVGREVLLSVLF